METHIEDTKTKTLDNLPSIKSGQDIEQVVVEKLRKNELQEYRKNVELLRKKNTDEINFNSGKDHAMIVMENLIESAHNHINIFAGSFDEKVCDDTNSNYCQSLEKFLIRGGSINVLLNAYDPSKKNRTLDLLKLFYSSDKYRDKIKVKTTNVKLIADGGEIHITTVDGKGFRQEYDIEKFAALFSFNKPDTTAALDKVFNSVFNNTLKTKTLDMSINGL